MNSGSDGGVVGALNKVRRHLIGRLFQASALWGGVAVGVILALAWLLAGPEGWPEGTVGPLALDLALVLALLGLAGGASAVRGRRISEEKVATAMDRARSLPSGSVLGAVELSRAVPAGVSPGLAMLAHQGVLRKLEGAPSSLAGPLETWAQGWIWRGGGTLALVAVVVSLLALWSPARAVGAWHGLMTPIELLAEVPPSPLEVVPGNVQVLRGDPLEIDVSATGRENVTLHWRSEGETPGSIELRIVNGEAAHRFPEILAETEYWVTSTDGAATPRFRVEVVDPLFFAGLAAEVAFPPHTGLPPAEYRSEIPPLTLPVGTRVRVRGRASRPVRAVSLGADTGEERVELDVDGARFSGHWVPRRSGTFQWRVRSSSGEPPAELPRPLEITLVPDSVPELEFLFPGRDTLLASNLRQPLVLDARDDYGLSQLELEAYRVRPLDGPPEPVIQRLEPAGSREVLARPVLDLSGWGLLPGDTVRYRATAVDNAPDRQASSTRWFSLRLPGAAELGEEAARQIAEATRGVEELARQAEEAEEASRDLGRQSRASRETRGEEGRRRGTSPGGGELSFEERESLLQAVERQARLLSGADSIGRSLAELARSMRDAGAPDPELRRDLAELQDLLREVATPELQQKLETMVRALDEGDLRTAMESLEELSRDQGELRRRLERSLERFRRAAAEQEFRAAASRARELAQRQEALARALESGQELALRAQQQEELQSGVERLEEQLAQLDEHLERLGEEEAREGVRKAGERSAEAGEAMARTARGARSSRPDQAAREGARAASLLSEAAAELESSGKEMAEEWNEEVRRALDRTAGDALALARRQEELGRDPRAAGPPSARGDLQGDQAALRQGVEEMAENLEELSLLSPETGRRLSSYMGQAAAEMDRLLDELAEGGQSAGHGSAQMDGASVRRVIQALNRVALGAMAGGRNAGQQGQGAQGAGSLQEELEAVAQQQGRLVQRTGSLLPLQLGEEAMAEQLRMISQGQQAVAGELEELAERQNRGEEGVLGSLEALTEEAQELAGGLSTGRLSPELLRRQERLFHRLLDAGRSLERDEFAERRESRTAGETPFREAPPLTAEDLGVLRYSLPGAQELQALPTGQRALVLEYFRRLNREGGGGGTRE